MPPRVPARLAVRYTRPIDREQPRSPAHEAPPPHAEAAFLSRLAPKIVLGVAALLTVAAQVHVLGAFGVRYADDDQVIYWYAAREFASLSFREPFFYGQAYNTLFESLVAAPLAALSVPLHVALPVAASLVGLCPWALLALVAWRRRALVTATLLVAAPVLLPVDYAMIVTLPRGFGSGLLFSSLGAFLALELGGRRWAVPVAGFLVTLGPLTNPNAALLSVPVALYFLAARWRDWRKYLGFGGGALAAAGLYVLALAFYWANPSYDLFPLGSTRWEAEMFVDGVRHLDRHLGAVTPLTGRHAGLLVVLLAAWTLWHGSWRRWQYLVPAATGLALVLFSLGVTKVHDGSPSVFFPYARMYLGVPLLLGLLAILSLEAAGPGAAGATPRTWVVLGLFLGALAAYRHAEIPVAARAAPSISQGALTPVATERLLADCERLRELAQRHGTKLSVHVQDRVRAYGCGAVHYQHLETLYPSYERRTWRLFEESRNERAAVLFSEVDPDFCQKAQAHVQSCELVAELPRTALVRPRPGDPVLAVLRRLGLEVRPF